MSAPILRMEQNHLLAALPAAVFASLASHLELVAMPLGHLVYGPGRPLLHAYFPTTAIVSLHYVTQSGASAADLVNTLPQEALSNIIYTFGEEPRSRAIARAIVASACGYSERM